MAVLGTLLDDLRFKRWLERTFPDDAYDIWTAIKQMEQEARFVTKRRSVTKEE